VAALEVATETSVAATSDRVRRILIGILLVIAFGSALFWITHWLLYRSDAYAAAVHFLRTSPELEAIVGPVQASRLSWFEHNSVEESEINGRASGSAELTIIVEGVSGSLAIPIHLTRDDQGWRVMSAVAGRQTLTLEKGETPR
jgi:hypothetical protein